ncbi:MAG: class I SAM-dependent methyltransferase [Candidatus Hodarchaeota archaeon]
MDEYIKANKELWETWTEIHKTSELYNVEGFLKGDETLDPIEIKELGDVKGKSLLHLMCHFGIDTLSWARRGAKVTGIDFSEKSIEFACYLAKKININAQFICSSIYNLPKIHKEKYDIVFTSGGVLNWLPDLKKWAEIISKYLKGKGIFYIREFHPLSFILDDESSKLNIRYNYFPDKDPLKFESTFSYADPDRKHKALSSYEWAYPISLVINSLIKNGLNIEFFNEFAYTTYQAFPFLVKQKIKGVDYWCLPNKKIKLPLMFSLKAVKKMD